MLSKKQQDALDEGREAYWKRIEDDFNNTPFGIGTAFWPEKDEDGNITFKFHPEGLALGVVGATKGKQILGVIKGVVGKMSFGEKKSVEQFLDLAGSGKSIPDKLYRDVSSIAGKYGIQEPVGKKRFFNEIAPHYDEFIKSTESKYKGREISDPDAPKFKRRKIEIKKPQ